MPSYSWKDVDAALDQIEEGDAEGLVKVYVEFSGLPMIPDADNDRWTRVTVTSFSKHVGIARHAFNKLVKMSQLTHDKETA